MIEPGKISEDQRKFMENIAKSTVESLLLDHPLTPKEEALLASQAKFLPDPAPTDQEDQAFKAYLNDPTTKKETIPPELLPKKQ